MSVISCTLTLHNDKELTYRDNTHSLIDGTVLDDDLHRTAIRWLERWVAGDQQAEEGRAEGLQLLGRLLYEVVFRDKIKQNFEDTFASFDSSDEDSADTLRLELRFHKDAEKLSRLPWEFLYLKRPEEGKGRFLAGEHNHQLVLSRFVPSDEPEGRLPQAPVCPVVLMAISQPPDRQFSVDALRRSLQTLHDENKLVLIPLNNPTVEELHESIESRDRPELRPDIFYFVGHGDSDHLSVRLSPAEARARGRASGASPLSGPPPGDSFGELKASGLQHLFLRHQPKLVFLQACKGDAVGREALYSLARAVVYAKVPAVIAMQYEIDSGPANLFAKSVFHSLISGTTIGQAVTAGRIALAVPVRQPYFVSWPGRSRCCGRVLRVCGTSGSGPGGGGSRCPIGPRVPVAMTVRSRRRAAA